MHTCTKSRAPRARAYGIAIALHQGMLVRYCAAHLRYFGYPRLLGVRRNGSWVVATVGGLCEACHEREREHWENAPYGAVLLPVPVEPVPRTLVRRVIVATIAATAAAMVTTAALLVAQPPDLIPSGGEPGYLSSGARLAGLPSTADARSEKARPAASRPSRPERAMSHAVASRAAQHRHPRATVLTRSRGHHHVAPHVTTAHLTGRHATTRYLVGRRPAVLWSNDIVQSP